MASKVIAIVGQGKLVGAPLAKLWGERGLNITIFDDQTPLRDMQRFDVIVTATGVPRLITSDMVKPDAVVVDAGIASEHGKLIGDVDDSVRAMTHVTMTPKKGGVGPLTYTVLFDHLIDNAIYYSPNADTVRVRLSIEDGDVVLRVVDHGIGVPKDAQKRLFTKFFRAENARRQRPDGTGIGLYLAKKVIHGHGGSLIFESELGKGSTFGFRLPIRRLEKPPNGVTILTTLVRHHQNDDSISARRSDRS